MSLYNLVNGVTQAVFYVLPMLGKHPDEYPRFRDCFTKDEERPEYDNHIHVYTRTGGGNRDGYAEQNEAMTKHPNYVTDYDDSFDSTFASFIFSVPEKWKPDFDKIIAGDILNISDDYKAEIKRVFPKLEEKLNEIFKK